MSAHRAGTSRPAIKCCGINSVPAATGCLLELALHSILLRIVVLACSSGTEQYSVEAGSASQPLLKKPWQHFGALKQLLRNCVLQHLHHSREHRTLCYAAQLTVASPALIQRQVPGLDGGPCVVVHLQTGQGGAAGGPALVQSNAAASNKTARAADADTAVGAQSMAIPGPMPALGTDSTAAAVAATLAAAVAAAPHLPRQHEAVHAVDFPQVQAGGIRQEDPGQCCPRNAGASRHVEGGDS